MTTLPDWNDADFQAAQPYMDAWADNYGLRRSLMYALVSQESRFKPTAYRAEPRINDASYGLTQILYRTAQGQGYSGDPVGLYDPDTNVQLGFGYFADLLNTTSGDERNALSMYNSGYPAAKSSAGEAYAASVLVRAQYFDQASGESPPAPLT